MKSHPGEEIGRRKFLAYVAAAIGALVATVLTVPVLGSFISPALARKGRAQWLKLGTAAAFAPGEPKLVPFYLVRRDGWVETREPKTVWVVRQGEDFICYNSRCTHLGCIVDWHSEDRTFKSPCHGGVFARDDGKVLAGPPPRPLDTLKYKVESGELWVEYQEFRLGILEKIPL